MFRRGPSPITSQAPENCSLSAESAGGQAWLSGVLVGGVASLSLSLPLSFLSLSLSLRHIPKGGDMDLGSLPPPRPPPPFEISLISSSVGGPAERRLVSIREKKSLDFLPLLHGFFFS